MVNSYPVEKPVITPTILSDPSEFIEATTVINDLTDDYILVIPSETEASVERLQITDAMQIALEGVDLPNEPLGWRYGFSPDGEWFIKENLRKNEPFQLVSTSEPNNWITEKTNSNVEEYLVTFRGGEWDPQSNAFFASGTDKPSAGCPYTYIL